MGYVYAEIELTNEDDLAFHRRGWAAKMKYEELQRERWLKRRVGSRHQ